MNKTNILAAAIGVVATTAIVAGASYAYQGDDASGNIAKTIGKQSFIAGNQEMIDAIANKDYASWQKLMSEKSAKLVEFITEENFDKIVSLREAMESGDTETAKQLQTELDMPMFGLEKTGRGMHGNMMVEKINSEDHEAIQQALENNDYDAWKNLMGDSPMAEKITADNFSKLVESHKLTQEGKFDEAKQIKEELGLQFGRYGMRGL